MRQSKKILYRTLLCLTAFFSLMLPAFSATGDHPVLIISSYNPDSRQTSDNISNFMEEFQRLGGTCGVELENMNCKSFSESPLWKTRMAGILSKYRDTKEPSLVILIGQEAWAAYLSLEDSVRGDVPVMTALASRNVVLLPEQGADLKTWMPESLDFFADFAGSPIKSGFVYQYDVAANIRMIKRLYPQTEHIAFISDNSYGGVTLQAHVVKEMKKFPELSLILLDGRVNTIYTISDKLHSLPPRTVLLMGTWRVDMNDGYFMRNATYAMMEAAPGLPAFSITSVGIGYWAVGGVVPVYRALGRDMARQAVRVLANPKNSEIEIISCETVMDGKLVKERKLDIASIPGPIRLVNVTPGFYEQYKYHIWGVAAVLVILLTGLLITLYFFYRTKRLKDELEVSEAALREAKDRAEESNRLKSAFLANMSHEIRTPLNAIVGFSELLTSDMEISPNERDEFMQVISKNSDLLLKLINDILDLSRIESGKMSFTLTNCDLNELLSHIYRTHQLLMPQGVALKIQLPVLPAIIQADLHRLTQVITNLINNAAKFTTQGYILIKYDYTQDKRWIQISVTDTGKGIPADKQAQVFERFNKLDEFAQGTGLGLAICQIIIEHFGGYITLESKEGEGSTFIVTLPYTPGLSV